MPLRPYALDLGFDTPTQPPMAEPEPERRGGGLFQFGANWQNLTEDFARAPDVWRSAFELENDVVNGWQLLTKPTFARDPTFNLEANLKEAGLWDDYRWNFLGVESPGEFLYKARQIRKEEEARKTLSAAGPDGVVALMAAGLLSPTTLLPFVGAGAKGGKAVALGAAWGGFGGALQEVPLLLNQELRTLEESGTSVAFSTILGAALGGGIGFLNRRLEDAAADMAPTKSGRAIPTSDQERVLITRRIDEIDKAVAKAAPDSEAMSIERAQLQNRLRELEDNDRMALRAKELDDAIASSALGRGAAGGADIADMGAGGLKNMLGIGERLTRIAGPVTSVLGQKVSKVGRQMMAELSTAGLRLEGNKILDREGNIIGGLPSNQGGTVESLINSRRGDTLQRIDEAYEAYSDYYFGTNEPGVFRNSRAATAARFQSGKLNRRQFFEEVGKAMWQGDKHAIPEVQKVAQSFRKYYDELLEEAQDLDLISRDIEAVTPDLSFLNRVYDTEAIKRNPLRFRQLLADHFNNQPTADLKKIHEQYVKGEARDQQRLLDMDMPLAAAQKLREQFLAELKALDEADDDDLKGIEELISSKRGELAENTRARRQAEKALEDGTTTQRRAASAVIERLKGEREQLRADIEELKAAGGEDLEARRLRKAELKSRIRGLNRSRFMVEEKARAKYDKISDIEDQLIEALNKLMYQGHRALQRGEDEAEAFAQDLAKMRAGLTQAQNKTAAYQQQVEASEAAASQAAAATAPKLNRADLDSLQPFVDEADANLQGDAAKAVTNFVGHAPNSRNKGWADSMGIMIPTEMEAIARGEAPEAAKELEAAFSPVREQLKQQLGDTITLYRVQDPVKAGEQLPVGFPKDGKRAALSWTADEAFAKQHAGVNKPMKVYSNEEIANFERIYAETGEVKIGRHVLKNEGSEYPQIFQGEEHITDTDSVRAFAEGENEWAVEYNAKQDEKAQRIVSAAVPLNDVLWVTDRAGQAEFIVKNTPDAGNYIDETGKLKSRVQAKNSDAEVARLFKAEERFQKSTDRFNELADDLEAFENINIAEGSRRDAEALIQETITAAAERVNRFNTRRAQRIKKLEDQIEKLDVRGWEARRQELVQRMKDRRAKTDERIRNMGGEGYDAAKGTADFTDRAKEIAALAEERILGTNMRLAGFDAMADARGTELARTLSIDSMILAREGFLVSDAEHLLHVYANTLIPDIEIVRRLGPFAPDGQRNFNFQRLNAEEKQLQTERTAIMTEQGATPAQIANEMKEIGKEYAEIRKNLDATIRRLRHQWGLPSDPYALSTRMVTSVLALQAWRFLGGTVISSIPDLAKPVFRYGLLRTMRNGWLPLISNWKAMKMTAADARRAFVAIESATADRAFQLTDLLNYARRKTKFEAGLELATSKLGIVFGFAPWTDMMKTVSAMSFNAKLMDSIDLSINSAKTSKARLEAVEFLNSLGLRDSDQRRIWAEMQNGGAEQINGVWVPQTKNWTDKVAIRAYRAALNNETSASIVTPGVELPKWLNASATGRLIGNLKSFAMASTSKTLMAGLQQRDMALWTGLMISLALGALSYYLRSVIAGGATEERMRNAGFEQWVDEALDASGVLGVLQVAQQVGDNIPYARNVLRPGALASTLQGKAAAPTSRSQGGALIEDVLGPSADLAFTTAQIVSNLAKVDRGQVHRVRQLLPMQNFILVRRLFDQLENSIGDQYNLSGQRR